MCSDYLSRSSHESENEVNENEANDNEANETEAEANEIEAEDTEVDNNKPIDVGDVDDDPSTDIVFPEEDEKDATKADKDEFLGKSSIC